LTLRVARAGSYGGVVVTRCVPAYDDAVPWITDERAFLRAAIDAEVPVFGICFGSQILAHVLGGHVRPGARPEIGWMEVDTAAPELVAPGPWLVWHFDALVPPPGAREIARTASA
jgi:GMP synthase (glutamine-hydrolysing)